MSRLMSRIGTLKRTMLVIGLVLPTLMFFQNCAPVIYPADKEEVETDESSTSTGIGPQPTRMEDVWQPATNTIESQITSYYMTYLGRQPDAEGFTHYLNQANSGVSLNQIRNEIANSPERKIRDLYQTYLYREPDKPGMDYWLQAFKTGTTIEKIQEAFRLSPECKVDCLKPPAPGQPSNSAS